MTNSELILKLLILIRFRTYNSNKYKRPDSDHKSGHTAIYTVSVGIICHLEGLSLIHPMVLMHQIKYTEGAPNSPQDLRLIQLMALRVLFYCISDTAHQFN